MTTIFIAEDSQVIQKLLRELLASIKILCRFKSAKWSY